MVMTVIGAEHPNTDVKFQMQVAGYPVGIAITDACSDEELTLIAILFPLQIVLASSGIQSKEMSGQNITVHAIVSTA